MSSAKISLLKTNGSVELGTDFLLTSHQPDQVEQALDETTAELGLGYVDLYLMHWPVELTAQGNKIRYIDVRLPCLRPSSFPPLLITLSSSPVDLARNGTTLPPQGPQHWHLQFLPCSAPSFTRLLIYQTGGAPIRAPPIPPTNLLGQISSRTGHRRNSLLPPRRNKSHLRQTRPEQRGSRKPPFQPNSRRNCFK